MYITNARVFFPFADDSMSNYSVDRARSHYSENINRSEHVYRFNTDFFYILAFYHYCNNVNNNYFMQFYRLSTKVENTPA